MELQQGIQNITGKEPQVQIDANTAIASVLTEWNKIVTNIDYF